MSAAPRMSSPPASNRESIPPLENGDRLTRDEFMRRYEAMPGVNKAELIEGIVYMPSPVRIRHHAMPHLALSGWLFCYVARTPGLISGDNGTMWLDDDNAPQPDLFLLIPPERGGRARISDDDFIEGAPELVVEVAASSASIDLHRKLGAYRRNGVQEYLVWRTRDAAVDWFTLVDGQYQPMQPDPTDRMLKSRVFPGLWLDVEALLQHDLPRLIATVERGTSTPDHATFVQRLASKS